VYLGSTFEKDFMAEQPFPIEPVLANPVAIRVVLRQFIELLRRFPEKILL